MYTNVSARMWRAMADPARVRIVATLRDGSLSPDSLAERLGLSRSALSAHLRVLESEGFVRAARAGGVVRFYELASAPRFSDDAWGALPRPVRRSVALSGLVGMHASAYAAVDAGGFDRRDMHLTRTPLMLDEPGWRRLSARFWEVLRGLDAEEAAATRRLDAGGRQPVDATAIMMLFTSGERRDDRHPHGAPGAEDELELHEHAFDLTADVSGALSTRRVDWQRVVSLTDQLRLVANAALAGRRARDERRERAAGSGDPGGPP